MWIENEKRELKMYLCLIYSNFFQEIAVKMESAKARHPQLNYEGKVYRILQGGVGIPKIRYVYQNALSIVLEKRYININR